MKSHLLKTLLLATSLAAMASVAIAQECATGPVTVGFLPKLDTDPYFQVAQTGAEEAATEIGGTAIKQAPRRPLPKPRSSSSTIWCPRKLASSPFPPMMPMRWPRR